MIFSFRRIILLFAEGFLILGGVAIVLFLLFYAVPQTPAGEEKKDLLHEFSKYANELSIISFTDYKDESDDWKTWFKIEQHQGAVVFKWPYLGRSENTNERVADMILGAIPETFTLIIVTLIFSLFFGLLFGTVMAKFNMSWLRFLITTLSSMGLAIPSFVLGIFIAWIFGFLLGDYTGLELTGSMFEYDFHEGKEVLKLKNVILPAWALAMRPTAIIAQLMESKLIEIYHTDYIRTARSNGLNESKIMWVHAIPNSLSTLFSSVGSIFVSLIIGGVFVEFIFAWKGFGHLVIDAIKYNDFRLIMGITMVVSVTYILVNALLEFLYPIFDPTLRAK